MSSMGAVAGMRGPSLSVTGYNDGSRGGGGSRQGYTGKFDSAGHGSLFVRGFAVHRRPDLAERDPRFGLAGILERDSLARAVFGAEVFVFGQFAQAGAPARPGARRPRAAKAQGGLPGAKAKKHA